MRVVHAMLGALSLAAAPLGTRAQEPGARPAAAALAEHAAVQPAAPSEAGVAEPGSELTVMLMTIGPGGLVWERFGHNAIWIRDRARGTDVAYNWGMFDFNQPNFLSRFLTGDTRYWMEGFDAHALVAHYADVENRSVWVQELNLTPAQRLELANRIAVNALEANKYYRYDYYLDNCSTRVRDALDAVLGGAIRKATASRATGTTYRWHTRRLTDGDAAVYTGIQLALGQPADREISQWEESFLPVRLMTYLRDVRVPGPKKGSLVPLVSAERVLYEARREPEPAAPRSHLFEYLGVGLLLSVLLWTLAWAAAAGRRGTAASFGVVAGLWTVVTGLLGTALLLAGTVTRHVFMGRNVSLSAYSPLALILLALVVAAVGSRRADGRAKWASRAQRLAALIALLTAVGIVAGVIVHQRSGEVFALALPVNVTLWVALRMLARAPTRLTAARAAR